MRIVPRALPRPEDQSVLIELAGRYRESLRVLMDGAGESAEWSSEPVPLSFQVAALLEAPLEIRVRLLATRSTTARSQRAHRSAPSVAARGEYPGRGPSPAPSNGVGGPHHEIVAEG